MTTIHASNFVPGMTIIGVETALGVAKFGRTYTIELVELTARGIDVQYSVNDGDFGAFGADLSALYVVDTLSPAVKEYTLHYRRGAEEDGYTINARSEKEAKANAKAILGDGIYFTRVEVSA